MKQHDTETTSKSTKWVKFWNMCPSYLPSCYIINQNCQIWNRPKKRFEKSQSDNFNIFDLPFLYALHLSCLGWLPLVLCQRFTCFLEKFLVKSIEGWSADSDTKRSLKLFFNRFCELLIVKQRFKYFMIGVPII